MLARPPHLEGPAAGHQCGLDPIGVGHRVGGVVVGHLGEQERKEEAEEE